jgi:hypothetical protein
MLPDYTNSARLNSDFGTLKLRSLGWCGLNKEFMGERRVFRGEMLLHTGLFAKDPL